MYDAAISPRYGTSHPNTSIALYEGRVRLSGAEGSVEGNGSIQFRWQPVPRLGFSVVLPSEPAVVLGGPLGEVTVEMVDPAGKGAGVVLGQSVHVEKDSWSRTVTGVISGEFVVGSPTATDTVVFHLPNVPSYMGTNVEEGGALWAGRLTTSTSDWRIDIDSVGDYADLQRNLAEQGGYGITHVGKVTRNDGRPVAFKAIEKFLQILPWWLTLIRSERTAPMLVVGIHEGKAIWEIWRTPTIAPWLGRRSWLPQVLFEPTKGADAVDLGSILQALIDAFNDEKLWRSLGRAIDWFSESVQSSHLATTVIFAQAGLELMSWLRLVGDGVIDEDAFKKLDAADALRLTLHLTSIELGIPMEAQQLYQATRRQPGGVAELDGPGALVEIRNGTIHPKAKLRLEDNGVMLAGGFLATRYLELLLLNRLEYSGYTFDRLVGGYPDRVPWL
jgi:hypothetical protein